MILTHAEATDFKWTPRKDKSWFRNDGLALEFDDLVEGEFDGDWQEAKKPWIICNPWLKEIGVACYHTDVDGRVRRYKTAAAAMQKADQEIPFFSESLRYSALIQRLRRALLHLFTEIAIHEARAIYIEQCLSTIYVCLNQLRAFNSQNPYSDDDDHVKNLELHFFSAGDTRATDKNWTNVVAFLSKELPKPPPPPPVTDYQI